MDTGVSQDVPFCAIWSHYVATSHKFVTPNPKGYHPVNGTNNGTKSGNGSQAAAHKNRLYILYILEEEAMSTMNKQIHDQKNGLTYTLCGDCYLPDLNLPDTDKIPLGHYGRMRLNYLREHRPGLYTRLILSGKLYEHLSEIDQTSRRRMEQIISQMAQAEGIDEKLKAKNQIAWVGRMNNIQQRAEEIILKELIYG